jgi:wyosine [tRNA(Phe)-imidazoG37] synthetase (radical SAM superfamily)
MEKPKFVYVTHINTTPEKLWDALTRPEFTHGWQAILSSLKTLLETGAPLPFTWKG